MTEPTALVTFSENHVLGNAIALSTPLPAQALNYLDGAVIVTARAGGGAGSDTLAALIIYAAKQTGIDATLVDFSQDYEEGPAWDRTQFEYACTRTTISNDLGADLVDAINDSPRGIIIINSPPYALTDIVRAERDFVPILQRNGRPYIVIWIDQFMDEPLDRLKGYRDGGGAAQWIVAAVESDVVRDDLPPISVNLPPEIKTPVMIPRLPVAIATAFYRHRAFMRDAVALASAGSQASFSRKIRKFVAELEAAL